METMLEILNEMIADSYDHHQVNPGGIQERTQQTCTDVVSSFTWVSTRVSPGGSFPETPPQEGAPKSL